jgi:hypothetical protein
MRFIKQDILEINELINISEYKKKYSIYSNKNVYNFD